MDNGIISAQQSRIFEGLALAGQAFERLQARERKGTPRANENTERGLKAEVAEHNRAETARGCAVSAHSLRKDVLLGTPGCRHGPRD